MVSGGVNAHAASTGLIKQTTTVFGIKFDYESPKWADSKSYYSEETLQGLLYDKAKPVEKSYDTLKAIAVDVTDENVVITTGGDKFKISLHEWVDNEYTFEEKEGVLRIAQKRDKIMGSYGLKGISSGNTDWVNTLIEKNKIKPDPQNPDSYERTIYITIPENARLNGILLDSTAGSMTATGIHSKEFLIDTTDGGGELIKCSADSVLADTTEGAVKISGGSIKEIIADTTSGNIVVENVSGLNSLYMDTADGSATVKLLDTINNYHILFDGTTSSVAAINGTKYRGEAELNPNKSKQIIFDTATGSLTLSSKSGK